MSKAYLFDCDECEQWWTRAAPVDIPKTMPTVTCECGERVVAELVDDEDIV